MAFKTHRSELFKSICSTHIHLIFELQIISFSDFKSQLNFHRISRNFKWHADSIRKCMGIIWRHDLFIIFVSMNYVITMHEVCESQFVSEMKFQSLWIHMIFTALFILHVRYLSIYSFYSPDCFSLAIPSNDPYFSTDRQCLNFVRSRPGKLNDNLPG